VVVRFVDIGGNVDNHFLNILLIIIDILYSSVKFL